MSAGGPHRPSEHLGEQPALGRIHSTDRTLIPVELPCPGDPRKPGNSLPARVSGQNRSQPPEAGEGPREAIGRNLRWAFPLPDSGSFTRLLEALEKA